MPFLSACARTVGAAPLAPPPTVAPPPATTDATAKALLDSVAENLLRLSPESATGLGIDTGARAPLRYQLGDRSALGQQRLASVLAADFNRAEALDASALSYPVRTSIEVVRSAYKTALEGLAFPYGDVA